MNGLDFFKLVDEHEEIEWLGCQVGSSSSEDRVFVAHPMTQRKFSIPIQTILDEDWNTLEDILTEKRRVRVLHHMTRIIGYFSETGNWNRSKLRELDDRQKGRYRLPGVQKIAKSFPVEDLDKVTAEALVADGAEYACQIGAKNS